VSSLSFTPEFEVLASLDGLASIEELSNEISVYAASPFFVRVNCGPLARRFLDAVPNSYYDKCRGLGMLPNIDIRVHRLNIGEYPAVPGWHCDGLRRETYFSQPAMDRATIRDTVFGFISSAPEVSRTEIITQNLYVAGPSNGGDEFGFWREVSSQVPRDVTRTEVQEGQFVSIGAKTLHRATPAKVRGWRLFFRMSMWHNAYLGDGGKVANQQQVYVVSEHSGW